MRRQEDTDEQAIQSLPITNAYVALLTSFCGLHKTVNHKSGILPPPKEKDVPKAARSQRAKLLEIEVERLRSRIAEMDRLLTEEQNTAIKRIAELRQLTFEEVVREAIDMYLEQCFDGDEQGELIAYGEK